MPWRLVALGLAALTLVACPGGEAGAQVPDGWNQVHVEELAYAVPDDFTVPDEPRDPQTLAEHVRGDPDDRTEMQLIGIYQSPATTTTGDEMVLRAYTAQLFGIQGRLAERLEDLSVDEREELMVDGAVEAQLLTVTFVDPRIDEEVLQTVVLVRTDDHIYDLRYISAASRHDQEVASTLPGTVHLP